MADKITAKDHGGNFTPHPIGQFPALCVDVINMGERVREFAGTRKIQPTVAIVFATGERRDDGELALLMREFSISMNERANLRQFLEAWRGRSFTQEQAEAGVPLDVLAGVPALLTIEHKTSALGRTYANVKVVSPLPKPMLASAPTMTNLGYQRPEFIENRKADYAALVAQVRGLEDHDGDPGPTDDDVPF